MTSARRSPHLLTHGPSSSRHRYAQAPATVMPHGDTHPRLDPSATATVCSHRCSHPGAIGYGGEPWGCGPWGLVETPPLRSSSIWELDLALGCSGAGDVACPQWDHVVQMRACVLPTRTNASAGEAACDAQAGFEIGRWHTSSSTGHVACPPNPDSLGDTCTFPW